MSGHLSLDKPLSKHDFLYEIKHWFRRAIWFLGFTAAYTLSPTILFLTVGPPNLEIQIFRLFRSALQLL